MAIYCASGRSLLRAATDTAEVLAGFTGARLAEIATAHGINASGAVSALRKRLTGALPDWRAAEFGVAGPVPHTCDTADVHAVWDATETADEIEHAT